jgi:hypothetical protein
MPTYLQIVQIPDRCFLQEVLLWVTFQRLPTSSYDSEGVEVHESREIYDYAPDHPEIDEYFTEDECSRAGIPPDPYLRAILEGESFLEVARYDELLKRRDLDDPTREKFAREREQGVKFAAECETWQSHYRQAIEYPVSRIFVALKSGALNAQGRLLPTPKTLAKEDKEIVDIEPSAIPSSFWTLKGIEFDKSSAYNDNARYCHITCPTREVLAIFPGERQTVGGVQRVGDSFVLDELAEKLPANSVRGRPSYPWDGFHIEVAAMIRDGMLPQKKEAAIHHFQEWFKQEHGIRPSRAAIGEKLKPYYEKFVRPGGQKIR